MDEFFLTRGAERNSHVALPALADQDAARAAAKDRLGF